MPDLDIIPRTAALGWKAASRLLEGKGTDEEVAKEVLQALGRELRDGGGLPNLDEFVNGELRLSDLHPAVAERFLWCLADHSLIGRRRPELVGTKYADYDEAFAGQERYKAVLGPKLAKLAERLVQNPAAAHLRAPAMNVGNRRATSDLLHADLSNF